MLSGNWYEPWSEELQKDRDRARDLIERYNTSLSKDKSVRAGLIASLLGKIDKEHPPHLEAPFYCDYVSDRALDRCQRINICLHFKLAPTGLACSASC